MKKRLCLVLLLATAASAYAADKCLRYTTDEMHAMTVEQLKAAVAENDEKISNFSRLFFSDRTEHRKCQIQNQRLSDVLKAKSDAQSPAPAK